MFCIAKIHPVPLVGSYHALVGTVAAVPLGRHGRFAYPFFAVLPEHFCAESLGVAAAKPAREGTASQTGCPSTGAVRFRWQRVWVSSSHLQQDLGVGTLRSWPVTRAPAVFSFVVLICIVLLLIRLSIFINVYSPFGFLPHETC